jgi:hypothetical protein
VLLPPEYEKATLRPPLVLWFPNASLTVSVTLMDEPEATVFDETVTAEFERE